MSGYKRQLPSGISESYEQIEYVSWFRRTYPQHKIFAIPNGGKRTKGFGAKQKAEGLEKGVHDLHVPSLKLWIEMKKDRTKKPTKEQIEWGQYVESIGHTWFLGLGFEDAQEKTINFMEKQ